MAAEMVRVSSDDPTRPIFINAEGWRVCVAAMDGYHIREKASWKRRLAAAHPDNPAKTGGHKKFIEMSASYRRWMNEEDVRYARLGLKPPRR